jgi:hypothetical protein
LLIKTNLVLAFLAATAASTAVYEYLPRNVDATVLSTGGRMKAPGGYETPVVISRFVDTDRGRAPIGIDQDAQFSFGQKVTCVLSHDLLLRGDLHDCKPK